MARPVQFVTTVVFFATMRLVVSNNSSALLLEGPARTATSPLWDSASTISGNEQRVVYRSFCGVSVDRIFVQLIFAVLYYIIIVKQYPILDGRPDNHAARQLQRLNAIEATCLTSCANLLFSYCCSGPRAAHTFHSVGLMEYVPATLLMIFFPCCTLFYMNHCTDLNVRLGGEQQSCCGACLCSFFCSCCLIAQDAESLDRITGAKTGFFGVSGIGAREPFS